MLSRNTNKDFVILDKKINAYPWVFYEIKRHYVSGLFLPNNKVRIFRKENTLEKIFWKAFM